ncbi:TPA: LuxR family transcriptional regulator [Escherichia coli]|uniref:helix-turn-helix transcriptional regulator n=1 Tax=Escherichia coli TaxID=562 RepID=UPI001365F8DC|nr:LuxR C-terminal-related transcriptional regulator [Escherichia coli]MWT70750.1 LuxR family transcriptional regulator [Escherichia coli]HAW0893786.1 LuxR family transcriptional regulator [Escherichia coli]
MQVFSSNVYFTIGTNALTNALLASQKNYYSDLVAFVDLGNSFVVIDEQQHRNLSSNTEPVNILLSNNFIRINKNIKISDLTNFLVSNIHAQNVYFTQVQLTPDEIDILRLCISYSLKQISIIKGIDYKTVSYHKIRALNKLNIKGTVELFIAFCEWDKHYYKLKSYVREI